MQSNKVIIFIFIALLLASNFKAEAYDRDAKKAIEEIEVLILKGDMDDAKRKCDLFLREYKTSRYKKKAIYFKNIAEEKLSGVPGTEEAVNYEPARSDKFFHIVQAGAFTKYKNATQLKKDLKKKGFDSVIIKDKNGRRTFYKVRVGKFKDPNNAERLAGKLKAKGYPSEIINE